MKSVCTQSSALTIMTCKAATKVRLCLVFTCSVSFLLLRGPALHCACPWVRWAPAFATAAASARCLCAATSPPLQLPPLDVCALPRLHRCSCLRSLPVCRHVSAAAAASARCLCAVFCNLRSARCVFLLYAMCGYFLSLCTVSLIWFCGLCSVTCAVLSGSCQPGCDLLLTTVLSPPQPNALTACSGSGIAWTHNLRKHAPGIACFNCLPI